MKLPKLNVRLLRRIQKHLRADPRRYNQRIWAKDIRFYRRYAPLEVPECGTRACIAGWAVLLSTKSKKEWWKWVEKSCRMVINPEGNREFAIALKARKLLGLSEDEAFFLFGANNQTDTAGPRGVEEGCDKIDKIIEDRKQ